MQLALTSWDLVYTCISIAISFGLVQVTVILEHMFHPSEMEEEATLREDLEDDIKTECTKMGPVEKVKFAQILTMLHYHLLHSFIRALYRGAAAIALVK